MWGYPDFVTCVMVVLRVVCNRQDSFTRHSSATQSQISEFAMSCMRVTLQVLPTRIKCTRPSSGSKCFYGLRVAEGEKGILGHESLRRGLIPRCKETSAGEGTAVL